MPILKILIIEVAVVLAEKLYEHFEKIYLIGRKRKKTPARSSQSPNQATL
jgi:hypothetical protein